MFTTVSLQWFHQIAATLFQGESLTWVSCNSKVAASCDLSPPKKMGFLGKVRKSNQTGRAKEVAPGRKKCHTGEGKW